MDLRWRSKAAVAAALVFGVGGSGWASASPAEPVVIVGDHDPADAALLDWALARFDVAGLKLAPLTVTFHETRDSCDGNWGLYQKDPVPHIDICGFRNDRFLPTPKWTVLHELAHAWIDQNLDEASRAEFLAYRGLESWSDKTVDWEHRGSEHAAEVVVWGLIDEVSDLHTVIRADPDALPAAYLFLTGRSPEARFGDST